MDRKLRTTLALTAIGGVGLGLGYAASDANAAGGFTATGTTPTEAGPFVTGRGTVEEFVPRTTARVVYSVALYRQLPSEARARRMVVRNSSISFAATKGTLQVFAACRRTGSASWSVGVGYRVFNRQGRVTGSDFRLSRAVSLRCR